jgi:hypothetical protein
VFGSQGPAPLADLVGSGAFQFEPVTTSAVCTAGGNAAEPLILPAGYVQTVVASEPDYPDLPDMNTVNETGASASTGAWPPRASSPGPAEIRLMASKENAQ